MLLEKIPLGRTLEIFVDREDYRYRLVSKVEDTNEHRVCVTAIASNGKFFRFLPEDKVRLVYRDENSMWEWANVKPGLARLEGFPIHYFQIVDKGKSFNRRDAYRVQLLEEVVFGYYHVPEKTGKLSVMPEWTEDSGLSEEEWEETIAKPTFFKGMIKDVSENGVGIYCDAKLHTEDEIFFSIPSPYGNLEIRAAVVREVKIQSPTNRFNYYYGCVLVQADRRLLRYIYDLQREILKRQKED
jgi:hypothetical protein